MPTYEYACRACGHQFEEIQRISEPPLDTCPQCGQKQAQRLISQGNFILKGSGWYTTGGYGTTTTSNGSSSSSSSSSSTSTSSSASSSSSTTPSTSTTPSSGSSSGGTGSTAA